MRFGYVKGSEMETFSEMITLILHDLEVGKSAFIMD